MVLETIDGTLPIIGFSRIGFVDRGRKLGESTRRIDLKSTSSADCKGSWFGRFAECFIDRLRASGISFEELLIVEMLG